MRRLSTKLTPKLMSFRCYYKIKKKTTNNDKNAKAKG